MPADPNTTERTEQKLRYARVHLDELNGRPEYDDFQRAHEESCIFHLIGAVEGTFQEMNTVFGLGLPMKEVKLPALRDRATSNAGLEATLKIYVEARNGSKNWLSLVYEMRNVSMHRTHNPQVVSFGMGPSVPPQMNSFKDPRDDTWIPGSTTEALQRWLAEARTLIDAIRATYPP